MDARDACYRNIDSVAPITVHPHAELSMNLELNTQQAILTEEAVQYKFVVEADLVHVGGGSAVMDY